MLNIAAIIKRPLMGKVTLILNLLVVAFLVLMPVSGGSYQVYLLTKVMTFAILALSLDLMWGYAGILSFGHSAFFALGAYSLGLTLKYTGLEGYTYLGLLAAVIIPVLVAFLIGSFVFYGKVSGVYFGIITLAVTFIFQQLFITMIKYTGGDNGLYGFPYPALVLPGGVSFSLADPQFLYYFVLVFLILTYLLCKRIINLPFGRAIRGIKDNQSRMLSFGYSVPFLQTVVFAIAAGIAGFAGALYVPVGFIHPSLFGLAFSTQIIVWVAVGGRGTLIGAVVGAFVLSYLESFLSSEFVNIWLMFIGVFMIATVLFWPQGIMGYIKEKFGATIIG